MKQLGRVTAKTFDAEVSEELNDLEQALLVVGVFVIELRQVFPDDHVRDEDRMPG